MKVLLPQDISDAGKDFLGGKGYDIQVSGTIEPKQLLMDASPCDAILLRTAVMTKELMQAAKALKSLPSTGSGG
jgi:D-3-phosphoglycerate dehydrogenase